jgi:hypothetical protein
MKKLQKERAREERAAFFRATYTEEYRLKPVKLRPISIYLWQKEVFEHLTGAFLKMEAHSRHATR